MNVGANSITDYGYYFAWGETEGYTGITQEKQFNSNDYKITRYNHYDEEVRLLPEDDALHVNWGGQWHIPEAAVFNELISGTTHEFKTNYKNSGVNGVLFTSKTNGNTLFFPACGQCNNGNIISSGIAGTYWTNCVNETDTDFAWGFVCEDGVCEVDRNYYRCLGQCVRGVISF